VVQRFLTKTTSNPENERVDLALRQKLQTDIFRDGTARNNGIKASHGAALL
jgi:hypothetical protein